MNPPGAAPESPAAFARRIRLYRRIALAVLVLGIAGAATRYWLGTRAADYSDDPSMIGFNRAEERQLGVLYGKQGQLIEDLNDALRQPGTQSLLIFGSAAIISLGCYQFSRVLEFEAAADKVEPPAPG